MELYFTQNSGNSSRCIFTLFESGIVWKQHRLDPHSGETRSPEYLAINAMGKVPTLVYGNSVLWESNAINGFIAQKHPESRLLPRSIEEQAAVQRWLFFQGSHVSPACMSIFRVASPRMQAFWKIKGDPQAAEQGRKEMSRYLPVLESALMNRNWLEGEFSLADIALAPHLWLIDEGGFEFSPYPAVRDWLNRLFARDAWQKTVELVFK
jgi:glutathione S-transferase